MFFFESIAFFTGPRDGSLKSLSRRLQIVRVLDGDGISAAIFFDNHDRWETAARHMVQSMVAVVARGLPLRCPDL